MAGLKFVSWCTLHNRFDICYALMTCARHPAPKLVCTREVCTCLSQPWYWPRPETKCVCKCHETFGIHDGCKECCVGKNKDSEGKPFCACLCHYRYDVSCGEYRVCCRDAHPLGSTKDHEQWPFDSENRHPFNISLHGRRGTKRNMSNTHGTIHLKMTVSGDPIAIDVFYAILHEVDIDFPIDPLGSNNDAIPFCTKCGGIVWEKCILGQREISRAAAQACEATNGDLDVRVHHWQKGYAKCGDAGIEKKPVLTLGPKPKVIAITGAGEA